MAQCNRLPAEMFSGSYYSKRVHVYMAAILVLSLSLTCSKSLATEDDRVFVSSKMNRSVNSAGAIRNRVSRSARDLQASQPVTNNNTETFIRQRRLHMVLPAYDVFTNQTDLPSKALDRPKADLLIKNSADLNEYNSNLINLQQAINERRKLIKNLNSKNSSIIGDGIGSIKKNTTATLEDDIKTINLLINMLLVANKKLNDQKNVIDFSADKNLAASKQQRRSTGNKNYSNTKAAAVFGNKQPLEQKRDSAPKSSKMSESSIKIETPRSINTSRKFLDHANFDRSQNTTVTLDPLKKKDSSSRYQFKFSRSIDKDKEGKDHFSVKPGFEFDDDDNTDTPPSTIMNTMAKEVRVAEDRSAGVDSKDQGESLGEASEVQYPALVFSNSHYPIINNRDDLLHNHKPIIAQDLLHVRNRQQLPQSDIDPNAAIYPHYRSSPESLFATRGNNQGDQQFEYQNLIRPQLQVEQPNDNVQYFNRRQQAIPSIGENSLNEEDYPIINQRQPMVPPYNIHGWNPMQQQQQQQQSLPAQPLHHFGQDPIIRRLLQADRSTTHQPLDQQSDPYKSYNPLRSMIPPPLVGPNLDGAPVIGGLNNNDNNQAQQPPVAFLNPLRQMFLAAKDQQATALAYERRRLEHEMELQKQQQQMKRRHEEHLEKQRQANELKAQQEEADKRREKQQGENQHDQSGNNNQQQMQNNQVDEEQPHDENAGNNDGGHEQNNNNANNNQSGDDQNQPSSEQNNDQQVDKNDEDMKNFQNFAGDTDFTELFPPGVLSQAEIQEMKRDQQKQQQREQEEQEERERQQQQQQREEQAQPDEQPQQAGNNDQHQVEQTEQNNQSQQENEEKQHKNNQQASSVNNTNGSSVEEEYPINKTNLTGLNSNRTSWNGDSNDNSNQQTGLENGSGSNANAKSSNQSNSKMPKFLPTFTHFGSNNSSSVMRLSNSGVDHQQTNNRAKKTRRSLRPQLEKRRESHYDWPQMMPLNKSYQDRYIKPFMSLGSDSQQSERQFYDPSSYLYSSTMSSNGLELSPSSSIIDQVDVSNNDYDLQEVVGLGGDHRKKKS